MPPLDVERVNQQTTPNAQANAEGRHFEASSGIIIRTPAGRNPASAEKAEGGSPPDAVGGIEIYEGPKRPNDASANYG